MLLIDLIDRSIRKKVVVVLVFFVIVVVVVLLYLTHASVCTLFAFVLYIYIIYFNPWYIYIVSVCSNLMFSVVLHVIRYVRLVNTTRKLRLHENSNKVDKRFCCATIQRSFRYMETTYLFHFLVRCFRTFVFLRERGNVFSRSFYREREEKRERHENL